MPRIAKGGKYVFGWSRVSEAGGVIIPPEAFEEYGIARSDHVFLVSGSKTSGGFCVMPPALLGSSVIGRALFAAEPGLKRLKSPEGRSLRFKGRQYCRLAVGRGGTLRLPETALEAYGVGSGDMLLTIRGSDIGFAMAAKGPLLDAARAYEGGIEVFSF